MKLFLTSAGLSNDTIIAGLEKLSGKTLAGQKLAFIPTAANVESGDKQWMIKDLNNCLKAGFEVDIVDISAVEKDIWLPRLQAADVLLFGGGSTAHLMHWMEKSGLQELLPELLKNKIYIGISAGSCVTGPTISNPVQDLFGESYPLEITEGLGFTDFHFIPHLNSEYFTQIRTENLAQAAQHVTGSVYALDDNSALALDDDLHKILSEGNWEKFEGTSVAQQ